MKHRFPGQSEPETAKVRWTAALVELLFNLLGLVATLVLRPRKILPGQHFHIYLMAYGLFRVAREFLRAAPQILGPFGGY